MIVPEYSGGSIVNLVCSLSKACGGKSPYPPLKMLPAKDIGAKNVIFLVIDALGYESLQRYGKGSFLWKHVKGTITSIFPSHTACCITSLMTGVAPQQHAIVGWHTYFKHAGGIITPLPYATRFGARITAAHLDPGTLFHIPFLMRTFKRKAYFVQPPHFGRSAFNQRYNPSDVLRYRTLRGMFGQITNAVRARGGKRFIYAYWDRIDALSHKYGPESAQVRQHFQEIDAELRRLVGSLAGTDTLLVVTADHGQIKVPRRKFICLKDHPALSECISMRLLGTGRCAFCFVRPSKEKRFVSYVKKHLSRMCTLHKSEDLIRRGFFGIGRPDPRLWERTGDYVLLMKGDHYLTDESKKKYEPGHHGGLSREEMLVPLAVIRP